MISLYKAFSSLDTEAKFNSFMTDLCSPAELRELNARWKIAQALWKNAKEKAAGLNQTEVKPKKGPVRSKIGLSQKDIALINRVAISTVTRVSKCLFENQDNGYRQVLL